MDMTPTEYQQNSMMKISCTSTTRLCCPITILGSNGLVVVVLFPIFLVLLLMLLWNVKVCRPIPVGLILLYLLVGEGVTLMLLNTAFLAYDTIFAYHGVTAFLRRLLLLCC